jgi:hypothetical protein
VERDDRFSRFAEGVPSRTQQDVGLPLMRPVAINSVMAAKLGSARSVETMQWHAVIGKYYIIF